MSDRHFREKFEQTKEELAERERQIAELEDRREAFEADAKAAREEEAGAKQKLTVALAESDGLSAAAQREILRRLRVEREDECN